MLHSARRGGEALEQRLSLTMKLPVKPGGKNNRDILQSVEGAASRKINIPYELWIHVARPKPKLKHSRGDI